MSKKPNSLTCRFQLDKKKSTKEMIGELLREGAVLYFIFALLENKLQVNGEFQYLTGGLCIISWVAGVILERVRDE